VREENVRQAGSHFDVYERNRKRPTNQKLTSTESSSRSEARNADAAVVVAEIRKNRHEIIKHIYHEWDDALSKLDVERLLALYAPDATLESPLVRHLLKTDRGVLCGRDQLRKLFDKLARTQPETRKFYRKEYFTDPLILENHRVYWGWFGVRVLERGEHFRNKA
jgi:ketosteroid isomerase-like protein